MASPDSLSPTAVIGGSHQSVERPQQEVWLYPREMELWKGLGSFDLLQLVRPRLSGCVVIAERVLVSWPGLSIMSSWMPPTDRLASKCCREVWIAGAGVWMLLFVAVSNCSIIEN